MSISRSEGRSATAAAAYRACTRITDKRQDLIFDYRRKRSLEAAEIALPADAPEWAADRSELWNEAELRERNGKRGANAGLFKANAVVAREFMFSFPAELSAEGRLAVARTMAQHLADNHQIAVDIALHKPGRSGDEHNHHCHMLTTTRRLTANGFGKKAEEWSGLRSGAILTRAFRALLAHTLNAALAAEGKAGLVHVEHRSFKDRGSSQRPTRHQGPSRTHARRNERRRERQAFERDAAHTQQNRHQMERAAFDTRQQSALAAKLAYLADHERRGIAAIKAELATAQEADRPATGTRRLFERATGQARRADLERQARMADREAAADCAIAALKAGVDAERAAYHQAQAKEQSWLGDRHSRDEQQLRQVIASRVAFDRVAEVESRRREVRDISHERLRDDFARRARSGLKPVPVPDKDRQPARGRPGFLRGERRHILVSEQGPDAITGAG